MHAHLEEGRLAERTYDFAGSRLDIRRFTLSDPEMLVGARPWSATLRARTGTAKVGQDVWLTADLSLESTDSMPFVIVFTRKKPMVPWMRELLAVRDVSGTAHVTFGNDLIRISDLDIEGRQFEVKLGWERRGDVNQASLFARYGMFSMGMGVDGPDRTIHLLNAREWYGGRTGAAPGVILPVEEIPPLTRKERREERKQEKKDASARPDPTEPPGQ
ncbi:MAG: hypothetical protein H0V89_02825 [Deltaproteobacteria bacterium]|nr:hypothetical protein [Deltaproteobacteria bacterium]